VNLIHTRQINGHIGQNHAHCRVGNHNAAETTKSGKQKAFHKHLSSEPGRVGPNGASDGHFIPACDGLGKKKVSNVGAPDEQDSRGSSKQELKTRARAARELVLQRHQCGT